MIVASKEAPEKTIQKNDDYEKRLAAVRRVDWRFLWPDPNLGRIVYLGSEKSGLFHALEEVARDVFVFPDHNQIAESIVCQNPNVDDLDRAIACLSCPGYIYVELTKQGFFHNYDVIVKRLQDLNCKQIKVYWHRPDFESALDIVPVADRNALRHIFSRNQSGLKGRVLSFIGRLLIGLNLVHKLVPCISIVAVAGKEQC